MGINGLTTFINSDQNNFMENYKLCDTKLIIDGDNFRTEIYYSSGIDPNDAFGGDYDKYKSAVVHVFEAFKQCNITPIVIFEGGFKFKKLYSIKERMHRKIDTIAQMTPTNQDNLQVSPTLLSNVFNNTLIECGIKSVRCDFESDGEIATVARLLQCPILSSNSDFYFCDSLYVPFSTRFTTCTCDFKPVKMNDADKFFIPCKLFIIEKFYERFNGLNKSHLLLISTLFGNDYVPQRTFSKFFSQLRLPINTRSYNQKLISALLEWLRRETYESAKSKILVSLELNEKILFKEILDEVVERQKYKSTDLLKYLDLEYLQPSISNDSQENRLPLPEWFVDKYRRDLVPSISMNIVTKHTYIFIHLMDDLSLRSSHSISVPIVQVLFGLITTNRNNFTYVIRNKYNAEEFQEVPIYRSTTFKIFPTLDELIQIPRIECYNFFLEILKISKADESVVADFPDNWKLFVASIIYWGRNIKDVTLTPSHLCALILSVLIINIINVKIGNFKSKAAFMNEFAEKLSSIKSSKGSTKTDIDINQTSVTEVLNNITFDDCLLTAEAFLDYFVISDELKNNPKLFMVKTVHCYAEFQSAVRHITYLNALLDCPMERNNFAHFYNGTFIYNAYIKSKEGQDPSEFIFTSLQDATSVTAAYKLIYKHMETLLPSVFTNPLEKAMGNMSII